jgi:hypothetical protein
MRALEFMAVNSLSRHHRRVTGADPDHLARDAYEACRAAHPTPLPPWEDVSEQEQAAWKAAVSAIAGQRKVTPRHSTSTRPITGGSPDYLA